MSNELKLFQDNEPLIDFAMRPFLARFQRRRQDLCASIGPDDLLQEARIALWQACHKYDDSRGAKFPTYAVNYIRWKLIRVVKKGLDGGISGRWPERTVYIVREKTDTVSLVDRRLRDYIPENEIDTKLHWPKMRHMFQLSVEYGYTNGTYTEHGRVCPACMRALPFVLSEWRFQEERRRLSSSICRRCIGRERAKKRGVK